MEVKQTPSLEAEAYAANYWQDLNDETREALPVVFNLLSDSGKLVIAVGPITAKLLTGLAIVGMKSLSTASEATSPIDLLRVSLS